MQCTSNICLLSPWLHNSYWACVFTVQKSIFKKSDSDFFCCTLHRQTCYRFCWVWLQRKLSRFLERVDAGANFSLFRWYTMRLGNRWRASVRFRRRVAKIVQYLTQTWKFRFSFLVSWFDFELPETFCFLKLANVLQVSNY